MAAKWESEKELGSVVVDFYRKQGWTVYPELATIDIIAVKEDPNSYLEKKIIGIECKKHFNLTVLEQAYRKQNYVDEMYVAVTDGRDDNKYFGLKIAKMLGIGVIFVQKLAKYTGYDSINYKPTNLVNEYTTTVNCNASIKSRSHDSIDRLLSPHAENYAEAGQAGGKQWSCFKKTVHELAEFIKANPGTTLREAIKNIEHHYSSYASARSSLSKGIRDGIVKGISYQDGDKLYFTSSFSS